MFAEAEVLMILLPLIFKTIACGSVHHTVRLATKIDVNVWVTDPGG
jgi:hypothetical protein